MVGHTGAGKTTLTNLLLRFYDVQEGQVLFDGVDIRHLRLRDLRKNFGIVLQDPFLFSGTIASNIRLGSEWITDRQIHEAARQVSLLEFIEGLPGGFQEPVKERAATLSVGQKQLLSFARALAHNPRILILDEATSSVDPETEHWLREGLRCLVENRTSLVSRTACPPFRTPARSWSCIKGTSVKWGLTRSCFRDKGFTLNFISFSIRTRKCRLSVVRSPSSARDITRVVILSEAKNLRSSRTKQLQRFFASLRMTRRLAQSEALRFGKTRRAIC